MAGCLRATERQGGRGREYFTRKRHVFRRGWGKKVVGLLYSTGLPKGDDGKRAEQREGRRGYGPQGSTQEASIQRGRGRSKFRSGEPGSHSDLGNAASLKYANWEQNGGTSRYSSRWQCRPKCCQLACASVTRLETVLCLVRAAFQRYFFSRFPLSLPCPRTPRPRPRVGLARERPAEPRRGAERRGPMRLRRAWRAACQTHRCPPASR